MVSLIPTKFHEILFSSFRGVALTNCVTDRQTGQKQYVSPTKWGGDIITNKYTHIQSNLWSPLGKRKGGLLRPLKEGSIHMAFSMTGQEEDDLSIQVTA